MREQRTALLYALAAGSMWGTIGVFVNYLTGCGVTSLQLTVGRMVLAVILLGFFLAVREPDKLKIQGKDAGWFAVSGILCILLFNVCYAVTIEKSSMAVAAVLLYTSPVLVTLLSIPVFHERLTVRKGAAALLAVAGCAFVSGVLKGQSILTAEVFFWGMAAAGGYAMYSIVTRILLRKYDSITVLFYTFLTAAAAGMCMKGTASIVMRVICSADTGWIMLLFACICNIFPYFLYNKALTRIEASSASVAASFEPVVAAVLGAVLFDEKLTFSRLAGIGCILAAVLILNRKTGGKAGKGQ